MSPPGLAADERLLITQAQQGDQQAFAQLVELHRKRVWAVCLRTTANQHDAEDALQETLVAAWRGITRFRGDAQFSTWLYRIASNAALARAKSRPLTVDATTYDRPSEVDMEDQITSSDHINKALALLPDAYRATFVLRVHGDLSYAEIAEHQGIPVQTVRSRLSRAKHLLRAALAE